MIFLGGERCGSELSQTEKDLEHRLSTSGLSAVIARMLRKGWLPHSCAYPRRGACNFCIPSEWRQHHAEISWASYVWTITGQADLINLNAVSSQHNCTTDKFLLTNSWQLPVQDPGSPNHSSGAPNSLSIVCIGSVPA